MENKLNPIPGLILIGVVLFLVLRVVFSSSSSSGDKMLRGNLARKPASPPQFSVAVPLSGCTIYCGHPEECGILSELNPHCAIRER